MVQKLRDFFHGMGSLTVDRDGQPTNEDLKLAAAVLLVELAQADSTIEQAESRAILISLEREFGLPREKSFKLLEEATLQARGAGKVGQFVEVINEHFDSNQKQLILAMVWRVISADGIAEKHETAYASDLRSRLGLSLEQSIRARRMAEEGADLTLEEIKGFHEQ